MPKSSKSTFISFVKYYKLSNFFKASTYLNEMVKNTCIWLDHEECYLASGHL